MHSKEIRVQALLSVIYTSRAVEFLKRHHSKPFFLLISHAMPHFPIDVTHRWKGSSRDGIYGDTIQELDWSVGEILRTLRELELDRRTAVFFTSDNGSWRPRSNGLLRGAKSTTWEGGLRVPLIARYPGNFRTAQVERLPAMMFDLYTTALALAEIAAPTDRIVDGESLLGLLREATEARVTERTTHQPLFFFQNKTACAVRSGEWKLHVARRPLLRKPRKIPPELYNLTLDPGESVNLAERRPEIVQHLLQELEQFYTKELQVPDRGL